MHRHDLTAAELVDLLASPSAPEDLADPAGTVLVIESRPVDPPSAALVERVAPLPVVIAAVEPAAEVLRPVADVVVAPAQVDALVESVQAHPLAATALVLLLRSAERRSLADGLVAESAVYSTLQSGPEFAAWREGRPVRPRPDAERPAVLIERQGDRLEVVLDRPEVRNALDTRMRDELYEALTVGAHDPSILSVHVRGNGADFCAGGDLDEFGSRPDPATAHLVRLTRSVGRVMALVADRTTVHLHGACLGSGIELPAFAGRILADAGTMMGLPEASLGLIPGAGGTVSLPARIGRHRTAWLALTGERIDAQTALAWGLVDELEPGA
jgi:enoyl-CoA hydratase/carnithine racemase